jgi:Mrp family chromosome partitioning ATPase
MSRLAQRLAAGDARRVPALASVGEDQLEPAMVGDQEERLHRHTGSLLGNRMTASVSGSSKEASTDRAESATVELGPMDTVVVGRTLTDIGTLRSATSRPASAAGREPGDSSAVSSIESSRNIKPAPVAVALPPVERLAEPAPIRLEKEVDPKIRFAPGIDEIFDQVWVKVQRRLQQPRRDDEIDEELEAISHRNIQSIVVTSWSDDEGSSTISLGLASRAGTTLPGRVCLVDADFHARSLTESSGTKHRPGLSELVSQSASLDEVVIASDGSPFAFIPAGKETDPNVLAADDRLQAVIGSLEERFRYVFYDTSSLKRGVEAYRWGRFVINTILVVRAGTTRKQTIAHAVDQMHLHGMSLLGTVLNQRQDAIPDWLYPYV